MLKTPKITSEIKKTKTQDFFVVGIGASAGGLNALQLFLDQLPLQSDLAIVIIQHLDASRKSLLADLLSSHTKINISEIENGQTIEPNSIYVLPANKVVKLESNSFEVENLPQIKNHTLLIDTFFNSLAKDKGEKAIGIILSGNGSDGTFGLENILKNGGLAIVQDPKTAQFTGMPNSAIEANATDLILSPEQMPKKILNYIKDQVKHKAKKDSKIDFEYKNQLINIIQIIKDQTGYDFTNYKKNTIVRRISKRIATNQIENLAEYITFLNTNPDEVNSLYKEFLIGVTSFFRDKDAFRILENKVVPSILENAAQNKEIRIWVCGCSTGEEAYSLAILFKSALENSSKNIKVTIFASDIDEEAIEFARKGNYGNNIELAIKPELLTRYFNKKENSYTVKKEIREMIVFAHHNLIKDPPFSKLDLITCRNLLIYIDSDLQKKIIPVFHYSLNTDGILFLGTSESIGDYMNLFSVVDEKSKIFKKNDVNIPKQAIIYELPFFENKTNLTPSSYVSASRKKSNISNLTDKILLDQYAPPSVIIDKNDDAIYFSGNTGIYLDPPNGIARFNILDMAKKGLKIALENGISQARQENTEVLLKNIEVISGDDSIKTINLKIKPLFSKQYDLGSIMLVFESSEKIKKTKKNQVNSSELEKELKIIREHLKIAIEELDSANDDLKDSKEDYQSSNEELQSSIEELETSREELQSVNDELTAVNTELTDKVDQLYRTNNDLNNLLRSIEIATLYLDRELRIKRYTLAATKIFNLIPSDIDRPVKQLATNLHYDSFSEDLNQVLKTLVVKSVEVQAIDDLWFEMHIIPYRTADNIIEGVLVTLVEITYQKKIEFRFDKVNEQLNLISKNLPTISFTGVAEPEFKLDFVSNSAKRMTGFLPEEFTSETNFWMNRIHPEDKNKIADLLSEVIKNNHEGNQIFRWKCADGKYKYFNNYFKYIKSEDKKPTYIVGFWQEHIEILSSKKKD